ncbi:MAG: flagellar filament capping protein FliD [Phycisphaerales bacterium]|nr:flagellar filament capping protein FliD [Planctomycetota bacterium]MCH8509095.1 flagellar filament capping protein FliD [Phycisphaerales bacterium]
MGGITAGVGLFSGIDSASLVEQLIASQSRPKLLAQRRLVQLQGQQAAYLDINSRLNAFKTAAAAFRVNNVFNAKNALSSDEGVLTASAGNSAVNGNYNFLVDRLVTTQQMLSRGFASRNDAAIGIDALTFEPPEARLDRDTDLNDLNNGNGITRGKIVINGQDVDLSRVSTMGELLDTINSAETGATASVSNGSIVLDGVTSLANKGAANVLGSLGLSSATIDGQRYTGANVYGLGANTALSALNDGRGVDSRDASGVGVSDFAIIVGGTQVNVRIGQIEQTVDGEVTIVEGPASTMGQVIERINKALDNAGFGDNLVASLNASTGAIQFSNSTGEEVVIRNARIGAVDATTTANDLGIAGTYGAGNFSGRRVLAGLNTVLLSSINGGRGLMDTSGSLAFTTSDGSSFSVNIAGVTTVAELINRVNNAGSNDGRVTISLDDIGTGLRVKDNTGGTGPFVIGNGDDADPAMALGLAGTHEGGVAKSSNLQMAYIGKSTLLSSLNRGDGIGTGRFEIIDGNSLSATININSNDRTLGDVIKKINDAGLAVRARINDNGDGIVIEEQGGTTGGSRIRIRDTEGAVARNLRINGEASGTGADNFVNGSFETRIEFEPGATLEDIRRAINNSNAGVQASIINDGSSSNPFRLSLVSQHSGRDGRFLIDTGGFDLGLNTLEEGENARVFFGSSNPANGVLVNSTTNTIDGLIEGVTLNLRQVSENPVSVSVTTNTEEIEKKVKAMVDAFNSVIERIDFQSRYNEETKERGPLLGDGTLISLRSRLFSTARSSNDGFTGTFDTLSRVGVVAGTGGKLSFNAERFRAAYADDPAAVEALFTRRDIRPPDTGPDDNGVTIVNPDRPTEFDALGVVAQLEQLAESYVGSIGGILQNRNTALDSQIKLQEGRIASIQRTLDSKRDILLRQFLSMEQAIAAFQTQGSALSQISLIG